MNQTALAKTAEQPTYRTQKYLQHAATLPQTDQAHLLKLLYYRPWERAPRHINQHGTPTKPAHHPPGTTPARHAGAPRTPHTHPPACARHKPQWPHATVCPQVLPTATPRQPPQLLRANHRRPPGPPGRVLRGAGSGPCVDHSYGHWHTPLPPDRPPLRHSGFNVAACHILLALYLNYRHLHLRDPQLPAPRAAALTPEAGRTLQQGR